MALDSFDRSLPRTSNCGLRLPVCGSTFKQFDLDWRWIKEVDSDLFFHLEIEEISISENKRNLR